MALTVEQIPNIVYERGYSALAESYTEAPEVWRSFIPTQHVQVPSAATMGSDFPYGARWLGIAGLGTMREVDDFEVAPDSQTVEGYVRQMRLSEFADSIEISDRMLEAANAEINVVDTIIDFAMRSAQAATVKRNEIIAGILQKGTLSAGSRTYFNQSYKGQSDANVGFIYDGKPLFAASGNAHTFKAHTATGSQGVNLLLPSGLSASTLGAAYEAMTSTNAIDERGVKATGDIVTPAIVLVGPSSAMRQAALSVTDSPNLPGTANNDINAYRGLVTPVIWNELTDDSNAWWLLARDPGLRVYDSGMPTLVSIRNEARRSTTIRSMFRFGAYVKDWRGMISNDKAAS